MKNNSNNTKPNFALQSAIAELDRGYASAKQVLVQAFSNGKNSVTSDGTKIVGSKARRSYKQDRVRPVEKPHQSEGRTTHFKTSLPYHLFLEGLTGIGKPSTTKEVGEYLRRTSVEANKVAKKVGAVAYMQLMYSSSSYLAERNEINRKRVGPRKFEYSLKEWKKNITSKSKQLKKKIVGKKIVRA